MNETTRARTKLLIEPAALAVPALAILLHSLHGSFGSTATSTLVAGIVAVLVVDLVWGWRAVRRGSVTVLANPTDAVVGERAPCDVLVTGVHGEVLVRMTTAPEAQTYLVREDERGSVPATTTFRGVAVAAGFELRATGPLGLFGARRLLPWQPLPRPLAIAPRPLALPHVLAEVRRAVQVTGEDIRGVRPYVAGDAPNAVHWPSSARAGELVVRELEEHVGHATIALDLGDGDNPRRAEALASVAAWLVAELLRLGHGVTLATAEAGVPVVATVDSTLTAGRRLAAAGPGRPLPADAAVVPDLVLQ